MKKTVGLVAILVLLLPSLGLSGALSFRLGYFIPRAQSDLWQIEFDNMDFQKSDFQNTTLGIYYEHFLTRELSVIAGIEGYSQTRLGYYVDFVGYSFDEGNFAFPADLYRGEFTPSHNFSVSVTPVQVSLKLTPLGRRSGFIPYLGGGISLYIWSVKLIGDMVDMTDEWIYEDPDLGDVTIYGIYYAQARAENRFNIGFQAFAGFMIPIARRLALEAEFKYNYGKGSLGEAFPDFESFDLGGYQISLGANYWF
jgi:opacity protein-like surface antigen